jgi:4-hydroxy-4-methyl-2-oxoglutarate aldolase
VPVTIHGQAVHTGDVLHGDLNGIVIVPPDIVDRLPEAIERVRTRERSVLDYVKSDGFSVEGLRQVSGY